MEINELINMKFFTRNDGQTTYRIIGVPSTCSGEIKIEWYDGGERKVSTAFTAGRAISFFNNNDWIERRRK